MFQARPTLTLKLSLSFVALRARCLLAAASTTCKGQTPAATFIGTK